MAHAIGKSSSKVRISLNEQIKVYSPLNFSELSFDAS